MATTQVPIPKRSRLFWVVMAIVGVGGVFTLLSVMSALHYRDAHLDFCDGCGSKRYLEQHRFRGADGPSWFGRDDTENIEESQVLKDWLSAGHVHTWVMSWRELDEGLSGVRASGWGHNTAVRNQYEHSPGFRRFVMAQVAAGALVAEDLRLLLRQPPSRFRAGLEVAPPLSEEEGARVRKAADVLARWRPEEGDTKATEIGSWADRQPPK